MKNFTIHSGNYSANGNFSGYTAKGERLFIHKTQMNGLGLEAGALPKFPIYAIGDTKMIGQLDSNGQAAVNADGTLMQVPRLQALSIFANREALTIAHVDDATLDIEIKQAISSAATSAGLTQSAIDSLLAVSL